MAILHPFRALLARAVHAAAVAAVPYDVVSTDEARALADDNPLSFLRVSRADLELPAGTNPYSDAVYERAAANFARLKSEALQLDDEPGVYLYRLRMDNHEQTGVAGCYSLDEYDRDLIKRHERTRRDKEDDRTRHLIALRAQTGPVLLTYRAASDIDAVVAEVTRGEPLFGFEAADGVRHTVWTARVSERDALVRAFRQVPALYIADGHHRAASAARARDEMRRLGLAGASLGDGADSNTLLAVAFPHDEMQILAYNRIVIDLGAVGPEQFLSEVGDRFTIEPGRPSPRHRGEMAMYFQHQWRTLQSRVPPNPVDPIAALDVSVLQDRLLQPVLGISDVRSDKRIDFVGGRRGTGELERLVDSGRAAVAFSLFPVSVADLMAASDAGAIMPPKSTWFEPKLRDGLFVHLI